MNSLHQTQIVIIGGGIAGLWVLNRLCREGYDAILLEGGGLGGGQTLASQGIIHGGLKYALNGVLNPASSVITDMPARWRQCLAGNAELDLSSCKVLSQNYYMWSSSSYRSRLKTFLGSKALHGRIDTLQPDKYPEFFRQEKFSGTLYQLADFVVDTPSLLRALAEPLRHRIFHSPSVQLHADTAGNISYVRALNAKASVDISAQRYILCAGEGNEALLQQINIDSMPMQRRPLHMVYVKLKHPAPVHVHCIGDSFGMTPLLTITSHPLSAGESVWYIGGEIAEKGVERSAQEQQREALGQLSSLFPWVDFNAAEWGSFYINRAEPRVSSLQRPDNAWVEARMNALVCWPTKLTLCPNLGEAVGELLQSQNMVPARSTTDHAALGQHLEFPGYAKPRWEMS